MKKCSICGKKFTEYGNNAQPINDGICCDKCNYSVVVPKRLEVAFSIKPHKKSDGKGW